MYIIGAMNILRKICIILGIVLVFTATFYAGAQKAQYAARIIELKGKAEIKGPAAKKFSPAKAGMQLREGDLLFTNKDSMAVVSIKERNTAAKITLYENTQLRMVELSIDKKTGIQKTLLDLGIGKVDIKTSRPRAKKSVFQVKTPTSVLDITEAQLTIEVEARP